MLRSILIGLDGSSYSDAAVELGLYWAKKCDAMLVGIGVIDEPEITRPESIPLGASGFKSKMDDARLADARRQVELFLDRFAGRCTEAGVAYKLQEDVGHPWERILQEAQRYDLILLGKKTYFNFEVSHQPDQALTKILKNSPRPVVISPERAQITGPVLIAYDGSLQAARTLQAFQWLLPSADDEVHVVSVDADPIEAARQADRAVNFLGLHGIQAHPHAIAAAASPASHILEHVQRLGAGLLVMGAYGKPALHEFFFGSVTKTLLKEQSVPLFVYH